MNLLKLVFKIAACLIILAVIVAIVAGFYINSKTVSSGDEYLPGSEELSRLSKLKTVVDGAVTRLGKGRLERRDGNLVLFLKGTPYEMGYQHGRLLKKEISAGTVAIYRDPISMQAAFRDKPAWMKHLMLKFLEYQVYGPIERNTPREYLAEIKGMADGAGISFREMFIASFYSDLTMKMTPGFINKKAADLNLTPECSSFAASGPATADGSLIFGRNTDYSGQGRWGPNQTIVFYEPDNGFRYVKVSTAGLMKCNSAMNEKGLVIGGHFMGFEGSSPAGASFSILENEIMRKSGDLDQALNLLKKTKRGGAFGLVIADGKSGRAAAVESTSNLLGVREMKDNFVALTNCATTAEMKAVDLIIRYNLAMRDVVGRLSRIRTMVKQQYGQITPATAAAVMSDRIDAVDGKERGAGFSVCSPVNVTSVVFHPASGLFWAATGPEPACGNKYIGFDFKAEIEGRKSNNQLPSLPGYQWQKPERAVALSSYMAALIEFKKNPKNVTGILKHLDKAMAMDEREPTYPRTAALFNIHSANYEAAEKLLKQALALPQSPNEKAFTNLLLAWTYDLQGKRDQALAGYKKVNHQGDENDILQKVNDALVAYAREGEKSAFTQNRISEIPLKFHPATNFE